MSNGESNVVPSVEPNEPAFQANVSDMIRYMRFIGICNIILGAITCIGIITALIGVPAIISGIRLREAADAFERYLGSNAFQDIARAIERQTKFFFIQFILLIISLVILGIYILSMIAFLGRM